MRRTLDEREMTCVAAIAIYRHSFVSHRHHSTESSALVSGVREWLRTAIISIAVLSSSAVLTVAVVAAHFCWFWLGCSQGNLVWFWRCVNVDWVIVDAGEERRGLRDGSTDFILDSGVYWRMFGTGKL